MRLYFVRHGESKLNAKEVHQYPDVPLSKTGEKQVQTVAGRFKKIPIQLIYSSDYLRARQTADIISQKTGKKVIATSLLRERKRPSELTGTPYIGPKANKIYKLLSAHVHDPNWHHSDEENFYDAVKRAKEFINTIEKRTEKHIAVITHGAILKFIVAVMMFEEEPLTPKVFNKFYLFFLAKNTGITVCEKKDSFFTEDHGTPRHRWHLVTWNDHAHLG